MKAAREIFEKMSDSEYREKVEADGYQSVNNNTVCTYSKGQETGCEVVKREEPDPTNTDCLMQNYI